MKTEAKTGVTGPQAKEAWGVQQLEEVRKDLPLEPPEGARSCPHVDFTFPPPEL